MSAKTHRDSLPDILPHGWGIDHDWQYTRHKNGNVTAKNYWSSMTENGFYAEVVPFSVKIMFDAYGFFSDLKVSVIETKNSYGIKDFLTDTILYCMGV